MDSKRPSQTLRPLSEWLGRDVVYDTLVCKDDVRGLVDRVLACDGPVLVAWEHKRIPDIARLLIAVGEAVPGWPSERFDMVWLFEPAGQAWHLAQVPQMLLVGDSPDLFA